MESPANIMRMRPEGTKRFSYHVAAGCLLLSLLLFALIACGRPVYKTFTTQKDGPQFSFQYPPNYRVVYSPKTVLLEIRHTRDPLGRHVQISTTKVDPSGSNNVKSILASHIRALSGQRSISDFRVLQSGTAMIGGVEAESITYSYVQSIGTAIGKLVVFNHGNWTWEINGEWEFEQMEDFEAVFARILYTFRFLE